MTSSIYNQVKKGYCRICGKHAKLSEDHIPPRGCFNDEYVEISIPYTAQIKGLRVRSICEKCNNSLGSVDQYLIKFAKEVDTYLKLRETLLFGKLTVQVNKMNLLRSLLGHLIAIPDNQESLSQEIDLNANYTKNKIRNFLRTSDLSYLSDFSIHLWVHPYPRIHFYPSISLCALDNPKLLFTGSLMSFYPLGILVVRTENHTHLKFGPGITEVEINENPNQRIDFRYPITDDYPFSLLNTAGKYFFLLNSESVIQGMKSL